MMADITRALIADNGLIYVSRNIIQENMKGLPFIDDLLNWSDLNIFNLLMKPYNMSVVSKVGVDVKKKPLSKAR